MIRDVLFHRLADDRSDAHLKGYTLGTGFVG
jgi:hypothetical protein